MPKSSSSLNVVGAGGYIEGLCTLLRPDGFDFSQINKLVGYVKVGLSYIGWLVELDAMLVETSGGLEGQARR